MSHKLVLLEAVGAWSWWCGFGNLPEDINCKYDCCTCGKFDFITCHSHLVLWWYYMVLHPAAGTGICCLYYIPLLETRVICFIVALSYWSALSLYIATSRSFFWFRINYYLLLLVICCCCSHVVQLCSVGLFYFRINVPRPTSHVSLLTHCRCAAEPFRSAGMNC